MVCRIDLRLAEISAVLQGIFVSLVAPRGGKRREHFLLPICRKMFPTVCLRGCFSLACGLIDLLSKQRLESSEEKRGRGRERRRRKRRTRTRTRLGKRFRSSVSRMRRRREVQAKVCLPDLSKIDRSLFLQAVRDVHVL